MMDIVFIFLVITILFGLLIGLRSFLGFKICALCGSVSATWVVLLIMFYVEIFNNQIILGILMGGSIVGVIYLLEQKLPQHFQIFKLPFFLTLVSVAYLVILHSFSFAVLVIPVLLWVLMGVIYASQNVTLFKSFGKKIIECCKNW